MDDQIWFQSFDYVIWVKLRPSFWENLSIQLRNQPWNHFKSQLSEQLKEDYK